MGQSKGSRVLNSEDSSSNLEITRRKLGMKYREKTTRETYYVKCKNTVDVKFQDKTCKCSFYLLSERAPPPPIYMQRNCLGVHLYVIYLFSLLDSFDIFYIANIYSYLYVFPYCWNLLYRIFYINDSDIKFRNIFYHLKCFLDERGLYKEGTKGSALQLLE